MLQGLLSGLKDLIYPAFCLVCKNKIYPDSSRLVCDGCWEKMEKNLPPFCSSCGRQLETVTLHSGCPSCKNRKFYFDRAFSPCVYTGTVKQLLHEFKYCGKDYLGQPLGQLLIDFIREYQIPVPLVDFVVPVPLYKSRFREREFNQSEILGRRVALEFDKELITTILVRNRQTLSQTGLTPEERFKNLEGCFSVSGPQLIKGSNILLIDDVLTTGATAGQAAKSLKDAGANTVLLLTLAS